MSDFTVGVVLSHITLFSTDIDKTVEFYKAIGLRLQKSVIGWGPNYTYVDVLEENGIHVIFEICPLVSGHAGHDILGFDVVNLAEVTRKLTEIGAPLIRPWILTRHPEFYDRCTYASFKDPDGRKVVITQHGKVKPE